MSKKVNYDLHELYQKLSVLSDQVMDASQKLLEMKDEETSVASAGFRAGQAYSIIDKVYDELEELTDEIDNIINR